MIQLIGILLCIYLVYKGIEIWQIGDKTPNNNSNIAGYFFLILSVVVAVLFIAAFLLIGSP